MKLGIDIGGTKVLVGTFDDENLVSQKIYSNIWFGNLDEFLKAIIKICYENADMSKVDFVGVSAPGQVINGVFCEAANLGMPSIPLSQAITKEFGVKSTSVNDGNAALMGEMSFGSMRDWNCGMLLTLGTGVGGGFFINRKVVEGHHREAGEFGHYVFKREGGLPCICGRNGCFEQYASTTALLRMVRADLAQSTSVLKDLCKNNPKSIDGKMFFEAVNANDAYAKVILEQYADIIGQGLRDFQWILDLEGVAIGGGISDAGALLIDSIKEAALRYSFKGKIVKAQLGNLAGIYGAALAESL